MIKEDDQIKTCGFKFVLGGVSYKKVEVDVKFKGGLTELSNRYIGKVLSFLKTCRTHRSSSLATTVLKPFR